MTIYREELGQKIQALQQAKQAPLMIILCQLLDMMIDRVREDQDLAKGEDFLKNQGKIAAYKELIGYIQGSSIPQTKMTTIGELQKRDVESSY